MTTTSDFNRLIWPHFSSSVWPNLLVFLVWLIVWWSDDLMVRQHLDLTSDLSPDMTKFCSPGLLWGSSSNSFSLTFLQFQLRMWPTFSQVENGLPAPSVHLLLLADHLLPAHHLGVGRALQDGRGGALRDQGVDRVRKRGIGLWEESGVRKRGKQTSIGILSLSKTFLWRPLPKEVGYFFDIFEWMDVAPWCYKWMGWIVMWLGNGSLD